MTGQQPQYESFIQKGHSILERTQSNSADTASINAAINKVNVDWDRVQGRLAERESVLTAMHGMTTAYYESIQSLGGQLQAVIDRAEDSRRADTLAEQREQVKVCIS